MRSEGLPAELGILVVEGESDRRLFRGLCQEPKQIVVSTNKQLSLEAHERMSSKDRGRIVFLVDCDHDVSRGRLRGGADLIITKHSDLEADLIDLGVLESVVAEVVKGVDEDNVGHVAAQVKARAVAFATPIGRIRQAARNHQINMKAMQSYEIDFGSFEGESGIAIQRVLVEVSRRAALTAHQGKRVAAEVESIQGGFVVCNGHDLVAAVEHVLRTEHGVSRAQVRSVDSMMRMGLRPRLAEPWIVVKRLRRWEAAHERRILAI